MTYHTAALGCWAIAAALSALTVVLAVREHRVETEHAAGVARARARERHLVMCQAVEELAERRRGAEPFPGYDLGLYEIEFMSGPRQ